MSAPVASSGPDIGREFDSQPSLRGELVELRPLRVDDFEALHAAAADPLIWEQHPDPDRWRKAVFREFFSEALDCSGTLVVIDRATGNLIGSSRFHGFDAEAREVEIGWTFLSRSHWGGRTNGEIKRLMLRHAFRFVDTVVLLVSPDNVRSQRAVEKIGGVRAGWRTDDGGRESFLYRIKAVDWVANEG